MSVIIFFIFFSTITGTVVLANSTIKDASIGSLGFIVLACKKVHDLDLKNHNSITKIKTLQQL